jgi:hypothetical protein
MQTAPSRTPFILAALGAGLASVYWAGLTLLIASSVASGSLSPTQVILPLVLVALYALRGFQLFKGDPAAARRILWLHGLGGVMALIAAFSGTGVIVALQGVKLVIHAFGGATALWALRASAAASGPMPVARYP